MQALLSFPEALAFLMHSLSWAAPAPSCELGAGGGTEDVLLGWLR